ncbi:DUF177 domain-containing protein [Segnochrobactrum spirostomi]|uniref:DUF177 domain-containing protein n=1 Tax=Segnochrobactrum spirostomi TaxID=2608987 RepID=UPI001297AC73|nr:DUF177 domain-containing protein [Segnochrobactrum spirostomi]
MPVTATEAECRALATFLGIAAVESCKATYEVRSRRDGGVIVNGTVGAAVVQSCVATLAPVPQTVVERVHITYLPPTVAAKLAEEIDFEVTGDDPPDVLDGTTIDLGAITTEHLALGLDPYPRAPGAEFTVAGETEEADADTPRSPFAELARLKGNAPDGER